MYEILEKSPLIQPLALDINAFFSVISKFLYLDRSISVAVLLIITHPFTNSEESSKVIVESVRDNSFSMVA